jgi:hypothetical protein
MSTYYEVGRYRCEVKQQAMCKAGTGTPQFVVKIQPAAIYTDATNMSEINNGFERSIFMSITEKRMPYFAKELNALGFEGEDLRQLDPASPNFQDLRGFVLDCMCKHENDQSGEPRERWSICWGSDGGEIKGEHLAAGDYRALNALFGAATKASGGAVKPAAKAKAPVAAAAPVAADVDNDLPF